MLAWNTFKGGSVRVVDTWFLVLLRGESGTVHSNINDFHSGTTIGNPGCFFNGRRHDFRFRGGTPDYLLFILKTNLVRRGTKPGSPILPMILAAVEGNNARRATDIDESSVSISSRPAKCTPISAFPAIRLDLSFVRFSSSVYTARTSSPQRDLTALALTRAS